MVQSYSVFLHELLHFCNIYSTLFKCIEQPLISPKCKGQNNFCTAPCHLTEIKSAKTNLAAYFIVTHRAQMSGSGDSVVKRLCS